MYNLAAMKTLVALLVCHVLCTASFAQTQDKMDWGEKFNSNGATLFVKETGRDRVDGQTVVTYNLYASGLPKDVDYTLWIKLVGSNPQAGADAYINKDGLIVNVLADPAHHVAEDPINLRVFAGRGEPKEFAVIATDGSYRAFAQVVPFPIENSSGPCHISATMVEPNYSAVLIRVTGLQPKEQFQTVEQSGNEGAPTRATAAENGTFKALFFPVVKGQSSGKLTFRVSAKACSVYLELPWGQGSYAIQ